MITFMESKEKREESENCLDSELWHACAGNMVQIAPVNSKVFYFPQGHFEHAVGNFDFRNFPSCSRFPAYVSCRVSSIKFMADRETDEVFVTTKLVPIMGNDVNFDSVDGDIEANGYVNQDKPASFAKTLTQSDANNGGGFSVPRYCAETLFPRLDYSADPPVQTILAKDVHGEVWKFRHIYRGTPRRHLLTTGWSAFVNQKKLVAGDSIVFLRAENGDLCVGIRRANNGIGAGFSAFFRENERKLSRKSNGNENVSFRGRVKVEDVVEAATLAANGEPFHVVYYPRAGTPEFCVKASLVKAAMKMHWCSGMRFKMAFETEDSSRISWFMGTILSVQVADPVWWPDSPWRLLQVRWDEPDLLQNVKRVNPWLVELVSNMPTINLTPFSSPHKRLRLPQHSEFYLDGTLSLPPFTSNRALESGNPFGYLPDNSPAGMQGARHGQYHLASLSDLFPVGCLPHYRGPVPTEASSGNKDIPCVLTMGISGQESKKSDSKAAPFVLFGQPILTEEQISLSYSSDTVSTVRNGNSSPGKIENTSDGSGSILNRNEAHERSSCEGFQSELSLETGHCKVFMESEDIGRTIDLSLIDSYEELYAKLASMFGVEISDILNHIFYRDITGAVRQLGEEPFSNFPKNARRLMVVADSGSDKYIHLGMLEPQHMQA